MTELKVLTSNDWKTQILYREKPVLIEFQAPWCEPSFPQYDLFFKLLEEVRDQVEVVQLDITDFLPAAMAKRIFDFPSLLLFKNGKLLEVCVGLGGVEVMHHKLSTLIQSRRSF